MGDFPTPPIPQSPPRTPRPSLVPRALAVNCPNCGNAMVMRTFSNAVNIACPSCKSILDATDPKFAIIQQADAKLNVQPLIPLGSRGKWKGKSYEVVGFQRRTIHVDGVNYHWFEYLLFNPYAGYRYFTEYNGHWNDVIICHALPKQESSGRKPIVSFNNLAFTHFQTAPAHTTYIVGEFPWQVRLNDTVAARDYTSPPYLLSAEDTSDETTWSLGEYTDSKAIWQAFKLLDSPPYHSGTYVNQPSPFGDKPAKFWNYASLFLLAALFVFMGSCAIAKNKAAFTGSYNFQQLAPTGAKGAAEPSFVTPVFALDGHTSNIEVETVTDLDNSWAYFNYALINDETGEAFDFGREVSYYHGYDSDGSWSEGGRTDTATIPSVPAGRYYLRIEPEMEVRAQPMQYSIQLKRDVPAFYYFFIAMALLLVPPFIIHARAMKFEYDRWQESDYAVETSSSDSDNDSSDD